MRTGKPVNEKTKLGEIIIVYYLPVSLPPLIENPSECVVGCLLRVTLRGTIV
jgi:hypothetical protein